MFEWPACWRSRPRCWSSPAWSACGKASEDAAAVRRSGERQDRARRHRRHDHARPAHRPQRRLRPAGDGVHPDPGDLLEGAERRRHLRPQGQARQQGRRVRRRRRPCRCTATSSRTSRRCSQVVGSPIIAALLPTLRAGQHARGRRGVAAGVPRTPRRVAIIGATYDIEAINGIEWLMENKGLKEGDTIGDLYFEGDYGEGGLIGVKYAAEKHGLKVVEQKIKATDEDMSGAGRQVQARGRQGDLGHDRPGAARVARGRRQVDRPRRADRDQRPGVRAAAARDAGRRHARQERHRVQHGAAYAADNPEVQEGRRATTRRPTRRASRSRR